MTRGEAIVEVIDLEKSYLRGPEEVHALQGASFTLHRGEVVALVGPSGSGKTTLLNLLYGWEQPDEGEVRWAVGSGPARSRPWSEVAVLPQDLGLLEELPIRENVELPIRLSKEPRPEARERMDALLQGFGLADLASRQPAEISLGEQQRAALARALVLKPYLVLADEPTGHQDAGWARTMFRTLRDAADDDGITSFVATHSREFLRFADRILAIRDGLVHEASAPSEAPAADQAEDEGWHREVVGSPDDEFEWRVSPSR